jgi:hypothetical protein
LQLHQRGATVKNRKTQQSALLLAGAAVGAAAAWVGKRRQSDFRELVSEDLIEADGPELPIGRSADPELDGVLQHTGHKHDETSGAALLAEHEQTSPRFDRDPLDDIWNATPGFAEGEQTEGYDAVTPEDLGSVWLSRATQTTHEERPHANDPADLPDLEDLAIQEPGEDEDDEEDDDGRL